MLFLLDTAWVVVWCGVLHGCVVGGGRVQGGGTGGRALARWSVLHKVLKIERKELGNQIFHIISMISFLYNVF